MSNSRASITVIRPTWQTTLLRAWTQRGAIAAFLWPASLLYRSLVALRRQLYRWGILKIHHADALVVVVGNVIAGGAGKTPTVIAIVQHLQRQNRRVAVVSRGYGRKHSACLEVTAHSTPAEVGDEPLLIQRATLAPIFVAGTRIAAAQALLARYPQTEIIVCDDGLQHYALYRDIEICVFDDRGCGNRYLLPAGPLREPWPRHAVQQAGQTDDCLLVLHTGQQPAFAGYCAKRSLGPRAQQADGRTIDLAALQAPGAPPLLALAGIAQPESFFAMLRGQGLVLQKTLALPDHYDFDSFPRSIYERYQLICTEKDAGKLWPIVPSAVSVPLKLRIEPAFFSALDQCIKPRMTAKLSLSHGHQIT